jgi:hypothetical protein
MPTEPRASASGPAARLTILVNFADVFRYANGDRRDLTCILSAPGFRPNPAQRRGDPEEGRGNLRQCNRVGSRRNHHQRDFRTWRKDHSVEAPADCGKGRRETEIGTGRHRHRRRAFPHHHRRRNIVDVFFSKQSIHQETAPRNSAGSASISKQPSVSTRPQRTKRKPPNYFGRSLSQSKARLRTAT